MSSRSCGLFAEDSFGSSQFASWAERWLDANADLTIDLADASDH